MPAKKQTRPKVNRPLRKRTPLVPQDTISGPQVSAVSWRLEGDTTYQAMREKEPIRAALLKAVIDRLFVFKGLLESKGALAALSDFPVGELAELMSFLELPHSPTEGQKQTAIAGWDKSAREAGCSAVEVLKVLKRVEETYGKRRRGRPVARRADAVAAYEKKLASQKLSWPKLAPQFCRCGEEEKKQSDHDFKCWQSLRQEVNLLKRTLRKHGLSLP